MSDFIENMVGIREYLERCNVTAEKMWSDFKDKCSFREPAGSNGDDGICGSHHLIVRANRGCVDHCKFKRCPFIFSREE